MCTHVRQYRLLARVEAVIDFMDDELIEEQVYKDVAPRVAELLRCMNQHLDDGGFLTCQVVPPSGNLIWSVLPRRCWRAHP
jgi:hypothetical protein